MPLIIVESPTKARTLTRFLGGKYRVEATMGHVRDLPKSALGVDIDHDFAPKYVIPRAKTKRVNELKETATGAESVILATDPDREGEAIAWHVLQVIRDTKYVTSKKKQDASYSDVSRVTSHVSRIVFHEITEQAIKDAIKHPREIDIKLVNAQQARRVLDRLVGYKLSPLLWQKLSKRWLSAGRVQSVAVRLIVEREREIEKFQKEEYWTIEGAFVPGDAEVGVPSFSPRQGPDLPSVHDRSSAKAVAGLETARLPASQVVRAQLISKDSVKYEKTLVYELFDGKYTTTSSAISDERQATNIISDLKAPFTVSAVDKKEVKRYPAPPFTTSTLQQEAGRRFYFSSKRTMQIAQQLYEEGLITYHRTDSVNLAEKFISEARDFIGRTYGVEYLPKTPRRFQTKSKVAQEAHEAIRPTSLAANLKSQIPMTKELNRDHIRLYELIWKRAVACQAAEAVFDATTVVIKSANGYEFEARGSVIKFEGFLKITGRDNNGDVLLPEIVAGSEVTLVSTAPTRHETIPPPRYTEATLVKTLEEKGIGRPSTYAPIISTIQERQYVTKVEKRLVPTELGNAVTDFLVQYFPEIIDIPFTSQMEDSLDDIANGDKAWVPVIRDFYGPFNVKLEQVYKEADKVKVAVVPLEEKCPKCSNPLVVRIGRYGKFIACSTFPKCDFTRQFAEKIDKQCPKCGGAIVVKKSRRGKTFYGCSNYPKCTFAAWKKEDIK